MSHTSDLVKHSKLETRFHSEYTIHIEETSGNVPAQRRIRREAKWKQEQILGAGSYGVVWLSRRIQDGSSHYSEHHDTVRAVKAVRKHTSVNYNRELEATAWFSHPKYTACFVKSFGWYEDDSTIFITMEYFPKGDLRKYIASPLPENEAQQIVFQLVEGLDSMHRNGFAHRDLKPDNILIRHEGPTWWVKIADFGISKRAAEGHTALRTTIGTPAYTAPEVYSHLLNPQYESTYTNAVDIWSLGVTSFQILTSKIIFEDRGLLGQYVAGTITLPNLLLLEKTVSHEGFDFVSSLLRPQPEQRPKASTLIQHQWLLHLVDSVNHFSDGQDQGVNKQDLLSSSPSNNKLVTSASPALNETDASASWSTTNKLVSASILTVQVSNKGNKYSDEQRNEVCDSDLNARWERPEADVKSFPFEACSKQPDPKEYGWIETEPAFELAIEEGQPWRVRLRCREKIEKQNETRSKYLTFGVFLHPVLLRAKSILAIELPFLRGIIGKFTPLLEAGKYPQAAEFCQKVLTTSSTLPFIRFTLLCNMGSARCCNAARFKYGSAAWFEQLVLAEQAYRDAWTIHVGHTATAIVLYQLGSLLHYQKKHVEAQRELLPALDQINITGTENDLKVRILYLLALTQMKLKSRDFAEQTLLEAVGIAEKFCTRDMLTANVLCQLGRVEIDLTRYETAEKHLRQAVVLNKSLLREDEMVSNALCYLGTAILQQSRYQEAEKYLLKALDISRRFWFDHQSGAILYQLGRAHSKQKRYPQAELSFREATTLLDRSEAGLWFAMAPLYLGETLLYLDEPREAKDILEKALPAAKDIVDDKYYERAQKVMDSVRRRLGLDLLPKSKSDTELTSETVSEPEPRLDFKPALRPKVVLRKPSESELEPEPDSKSIPKLKPKRKVRLKSKTIHPIENFM